MLEIVFDSDHWEFFSGTVCPCTVWSDVGGLHLKSLDIAHPHLAWKGGLLEKRFLLSPRGQWGLYGFDMVNQVLEFFWRVGQFDSRRAVRGPDTSNTKHCLFVNPLSSALIWLKSSIFRYAFKSRRFPSKHLREGIKASYLKPTIIGHSASALFLQ